MRKQRNRCSRLYAASLSAISRLLVRSLATGAAASSEGRIEVEVDSIGFTLCKLDPVENVLVRFDESSPRTFSRITRFAIRKRSARFAMPIISESRSTSGAEFHVSKPAPNRAIRDAYCNRNFKPCISFGKLKRSSLSLLGVH